MGVNGPRRGRFDLAFEKWCAANRYFFLRTVDLFWAFEYHRNGFPMRLHPGPIRKNWIEERKQRREAPRKIREGRIFHFSIDLKKLSKQKLRDYIDYWYPHPGPWKEYHSERRAYFRDELDRYEAVMAFWRKSAELRKMFLRCAEFSNRRPESHPDYLVLFQRRGKMKSAFVEVKSPRESLRPSQRRFFPELVRAGQRVLLVRLTEEGEKVRFFEFDSRRCKPTLMLA